MRWLLALALLVGCSASTTKERPAAHARPLSEDDLRAAGEFLSKQLAPLKLEGLPTLRVVGREDDPLVEETRRRAVESNKFAVSANPERKPDYVLDPEPLDDGVSFELIELATKRRVFLATWKRAN